MKTTRDVSRTEIRVCVALLALLAVVAALFLADILLAAERATQLTTHGPSHALPSGVTMREPWRHYAPQRMHECINGRVRVFLEFGAHGLDFAAITHRDAPYDVYVYQMQDEQAALGVYLREGTVAARKLPIAVNADIASGAVRFVAGQHYVCIYPMDRINDEAMAEEIAVALLHGIRAGVTETERTVLSRFPTAGLIEGSKSLNVDGALGILALRGTFSTRYEADDDEVELVAQHLDAIDGVARIAELNAELSELGCEQIAHGETTFSCMLFGKTLLVEVRTPWFVGVFGPDDLAASRARLDRFVRVLDATP